MSGRLAPAVAVTGVPPSTLTATGIGAVVSGSMVHPVALRSVEPGTRMIDSDAPYGSNASRTVAHRRPEFADPYKVLTAIAQTECEPSGSATVAANQWPECVAPARFARVVATARPSATIRTLTGAAVSGSLAHPVMCAPGECWVTATAKTLGSQLNDFEMHCTVRSWPYVPALRPMAQIVRAPATSRDPGSRKRAWKPCPGFVPAASAAVTVPSTVPPAVIVTPMGAAVSGSLALPASRTPPGTCTSVLIAPLGLNVTVRETQRTVVFVPAPTLVTLRQTRWVPSPIGKLSA